MPPHKPQTPNPKREPHRTPIEPFKEPSTEEPRNPLKPKPRALDPEEAAISEVRGGDYML